MGTALEAGEEQKCNQPKKDDDGCGDSDDAKSGFTARDAEDTSIEEEGADFDAGKSAGREDIPCYLHLKVRSAEVRRISIP